MQERILWEKRRKLEALHDRLVAAKPVLRAAQPGRHARKRRYTVESIDEIVRRIA